MSKTRIIEVVNEDRGYGRVHLVKSKHTMPLPSHLFGLPTYTTVCENQFNAEWDNFSFTNRTVNDKNMTRFSKCKKCFKNTTN